MTRLLYRHSRGAWGQDKAQALLDAADQTLALWGEDGLDFVELADDIAVEVRLAQQLALEITALEERIDALSRQADPDQLVASGPGIGPILAAAILGRLGDAKRFANLAGVRAFTGLVPAIDQSGTGGRHGGPTKAGDAYLREALFNAADHARRVDPTLAARYHRLRPRRASTTLPRCAPSRQCWSPGLRPAGEPASPTNSATPTAARSPRAGTSDLHPALHRSSRHPQRPPQHPPKLGPQEWDRPAKQGVAKRSINRPVHPHPTRPPTSRQHQPPTT